MISREEAINICTRDLKIMKLNNGIPYGTIEALEQAISDMQKLEKIEQNLEHIDIAIRCGMCTNSMANDRGCDGGCRLDEDMYKKVMNVIDKEIGQIVKGEE